MTYICDAGLSTSVPECETMNDIISYYLYYYQKETLHFWNTLGPREYATILMVVATVGWLAMKSNLKR
jgi:hypothetical protein